MVISFGGLSSLASVSTSIRSSIITIRGCSSIEERGMGKPFKCRLLTRSNSCWCVLSGLSWVIELEWLLSAKNALVKNWKGLTLAKSYESPYRTAIRVPYLWHLNFYWIVINGNELNYGRMSPVEYNLFGEEDITITYLNETFPCCFLHQTIVR